MIQYIIKALLNDDSIFINDLGTFTKTYQSARFDGDTMLPPQYVVTLTVKDDQPDSTEFINLVCREKQCRITEASAEINQWVEELKTAIENNKEVEFDNFGTFSLNNKGIITFVCDHIDELNREFEGMGVVRLGDEVQEVQEEMKDEEIRRLQEEEEERRLQEEAEQRLREAEEQERLAKEAEEKRLQEEAEQRLKDAEEQERLAKEAEEKRLQEEAEQRLREAEEQERLAKEAEEKRLQEEAEQRLREAEEQERLAKEAEERRLQEEAEQRLREAEEQGRLAKEAEEKRLQEEAEQRLKEAEEQKKLAKEKEVNEVKVVNEVQEVDEVKVEDKGADNEVKKPVKRKKKRSSWWWLFVLLILIALGVLGYLFRQQLTDTFHRIKMEFTATDEEVITDEDETAAEETATYEEETQEAQEEEVATEPEVYTPEVMRTTANGNYPVIRFEQGHYYVIAGSLPTEQDAVRHIKQRNLDQYEPKIVLQNGVSNLRVCIGIFDTEEEAETFAKNVNPKYWVLK